MIKIENTMVTGWRPAMRGARNPMNSWDKSDSLFFPIRSLAVESLDGQIIFYNDEFGNWIYCGADKRKPLYSWTMDDKTGQLFHENLNKLTYSDVPVIGPNDLKLLTNLAKAGSDEAKFRRMIAVYVDITAPLYWWKEADTYKVGTVRNSCSTMHKIHAKEFVPEDFSIDRLALGPENIMYATIHDLNELRKLYLEFKDKDIWYQMIQLLPSSYNQRATLMLNYEVLANMYHARKNHKLDEWRSFCRWIETLPYANELIVGGE